MNAQQKLRAAKEVARITGAPLAVAIRAVYIAEWEISQEKTVGKDTVRKLREKGLI